MLRRILFISLIVFATASAHAEWPRPAGFVNDFASVVSPRTKAALETVLSSFEKQTGNEVAVATLPSLEGRPIEDAAPDLYKQWGIGKKGKDNGVLFLIAPGERKARIEVGYGLEGAINDALAGRLLDEEVIPRFKAGDIDAGIAAGTVAIVRTIVQKEGLAFNIQGSLEGGSAAMPAQRGKPIPLALKIVGLIFMAYLFIRHPWLFLLLLSSSGRGGGGSFGGGFGGFGGGLSGGGGASRGW